MASGEGESVSECQAEPTTTADESTLKDEGVSKADTPTHDTQHEPTQPEIPEASADSEPVAAGRDVVIVGTPMSGSLGVVDEFLDEKQRWRVKFASGVAKNFKAENLRVVKTKKQKRRREVNEIRLETPNYSEITATAQAADHSVSQIMERLGAAPSAPLPHNAPAVAPDANIQPEEEAPVQETAAEDHGTAVISSLPANVAEPAFQVNLAGQHFAEKTELRAHLRQIQDRCGQTEDGKVTSIQDLLLLYHLVMQHSKLAEKLRIDSGSAVQGFRYATDPRFPKNQCFIILFADGISEPVSVTKCVNAVFSEGNVELRPPADDAGPATKRARVARDPFVRATDVEKEQSRAETGLVLIREEASAASGWEYALMDERRRCFAAYLPSPFAGPVLQNCFDKARAGTTWIQPEDPRSGEPIPRKTAWMVKPGYTCTYRYGGIDVAPQEFPPWILEIMQMYMPLCGLADREAWPDSCNLNLYEDGSMSVGWHADDERLFQGRTDDIRIISVSLGQTRTFELRTQGIEEDGARAKCAMKLSNGDMCTMEGLTQKHYHHRVPKEATSDGPRINFTWRWIKQYRPGIPTEQPKKKKRLAI